jgi:uncharacterized Zn-binding protein involved in type VI secretion
MPAAARMTDKILQNNPHCHAPIHPNVPVAHPPMPWTIVSACAPTVFIDNLQAAVVGSTSTPCTEPTCVPNGPGVISKGSMVVFHCSLPAARLNDMTAHAGCVGPIPAPVGKVIPPCSQKVDIGG